MLRGCGDTLVALFKMGSYAVLELRVHIATRAFLDRWRPRLARMLMAARLC